MITRSLHCRQARFEWHSPIVGATCDHAEVTKLKLDKVLGLASLNVQHDGVIDLETPQHYISYNE